MTNPANRNNIEPMFFGVTIVVVILFCLFGTTRTFQRCRRWYFASINSISNGRCSKSLIGVTQAIPFCFQMFICLEFVCLTIQFFGNFTFFALPITFFAQLCGKFTFFCLVIMLLVLSIAFFAIILKAIFADVMFVKFFDRFDLLTSATFLHIANCIESGGYVNG